MNRKSVVSVICEYNPFHFGHKYQLDRLREKFGAVVCILSGNIVQRGSVAVADKYLRAEAALFSGADLVLELPIPYCCASARDFAAAGVHIADAIGSDVLAFGAEDSDDILFDIHALLSRGDFAEELKTVINENKNLSYPQALTALIGRHLGEVAAGSVKKPNNILSLEYLKAIEGTALKPFTVRRQEEFDSSSQIRALGDGENMLLRLPEKSREIFGRELGKRFPRNERITDAFFVGTLRRLGNGAELSRELYSAPADLVKKILQAAVKHSSIAEITAACADKNYTHARVRRCINSIVFGITADRVHKKPPYTSVLAANTVGREILRSAKAKNSICIVNKPVRALEMGDDTKNAFLFAKGIEDILALSDPVPAPADTGKNPIIGEF